MRQVRLLLCAGAALWAHPALAADALKFGPPPAWVHPQSIPAAKASEAPVALLLDDQQTAFDHGKMTTYREGAIKFLNAQGLTAGNVAMVWQPATDTVTVNKLHIIRGDKVIDVLAGGQTFTILRREQNLDAATLDGTLTATLQPEGLQVGDIIDYATTTEHNDPVMKGHAETMFGAWDSLPIEAAHASLIWPKDLHLQLKQTPNLPPPRQSQSGSTNMFELSGLDVQPLIEPKGAPARFKIGRLAEASDFASWSDVANLFIPLFRDASAIPASGPLHDEVEKIRAASKDPKVRAQQALALVQDRVRYVALLMGQGGYVPAPAETTWSRRFGDCKGKTALLLGILHSLGIEAEPVLAEVGAGDMVADRLPMVALFNHVLVRAHIGGKDYWLDGTRSGDTDLDLIEVPDFGWGLPLVANAKLVHMVPAVLANPNTERHVNIDATAGVFAPAAISIEEVYRGDTAVETNIAYSALTDAQRDDSIRDKAREYFDGFTVSSSSVQFDKDKRELHLQIKGTAKLNWKDSWLYVPTSSIAFDPDFDRPAGPLHDVPWAIGFPSFIKDEAVLRLPRGFAAHQKLSAPVHETLAGVEYARTETVNGDVLTVDSSERSIVPEVPYKDAVAAASRLKALNRDDVYLNASVYNPSAKDLAAIGDQALASADEYVARGNLYLNGRKLDGAIADFTSALKLQPNNVWALADRGLAYAWKRQFDEAEKDLDAADAAEKGNAVTLRARGLIAHMRDNCTVAIDFYTQSLAKEANNPFALMQRASCEASMLKTDAALADLTAVIDRDPKNVAAIAARALIEANKRDFDAANKDIAAAEAINPGDQAVAAARSAMAALKGDFSAMVAMQSKMIAENPNDGARYAARAATYMQTGKLDLALADTDKALALGLKTPDLRLLRANIFKMQGKNELVANEADLLTKEYPTSEFAFVAAAKSYAALGQRDKAMELFGRALAIKPEAYIYVNRAQVRPASDLTGQLADVDEALKLEPKMPEALSLKASILSKQGKFSEAIALYDQMPKSGANDTWIESQRALLLAKAGRTSEASQAFADLRAKAKSANELNSLCWTEGTAGVMLADAVEECREAVKLGNRNPEYVDSLGMALLKLGKLDEALAAYNESVEKGHVAASYMGRAMIYDRKGDLAHAQADFAQAKKLESGIEDRFADYGLKFQHPIRAEVPRPANPDTKELPVKAPPKVTVVSITPN